MKLIVELTPDESEKACRDISADLPEWFGLPEANERYAKGVRERITFGYKINGVQKRIIGVEAASKNLNKSTHDTLQHTCRPN